MTLPINFLYLGGDKCGSTWIYHILSQHPDVTLARAKELFYFDRFYDKGADWYAKQFPADTGRKCVGEICHDYLYSEEALQRIAQDMPADSRFLITVRAPVERTVSHYKYLRKIGTARVSFDDALTQHPQIIEHSMFGKYVAMAQKHLGKDRVHVLPFELLKEDAAAFGAAMSTALDIPFDPSLPYTDRVLEAQSARNPALVRLLRNTGWVIRKIGAPQIVSMVKSSALVSRLLYSNKKSGAQSDEISATVLQNVEAQFAADQALLADCVPDLWRPQS